jgi:hypothetical protein
MQTLEPEGTAVTTTSPIRRLLELLLPLRTTLFFLFAEIATVGALYDHRPTASATLLSKITFFIPAILVPMPWLSFRTYAQQLRRFMQNNLDVDERQIEPLASTVRYMLDAAYLALMYAVLTINK